MIRKPGVYCAYLRKSRADMDAEALGKGETLARHEHELNELASRLGIVISRFYREIVSGDTIAERPEVRALLDDINAGMWDGVLVMDVDRLGRGDSIDQGVIMQTFTYTNTLIVTPGKIYDPSDDSDAEFFEIKLFFSRREYSAIKKRMQRGRLISATEGCYMGSRPVYGYERVKLKGRKGWSLEVVPDKAEIVRAVFEWYAYGMDGQNVGAGAIANRLNEMGLRTDLGKPFYPSGIRDMLKNPVYIGKVRWNQRVTTNRIEDGKRVRTRQPSDHPVIVDGFHRPIIDEALFNAVQEKFAHSFAPRKNAKYALVNPVCGLVRCGICGFTMMLKPDASRSKQFVFCPTLRCPTASAQLPAVEESLLDFLRRWLRDFEAESVASKNSGLISEEARESARRQLEDQQRTLHQQLDRLYDLLEQGVYTPEIYRQRKGALDTRIAETDAAIAQLNGATKNDARVLYAERVRKVLDAYQTTTDPAEKNSLLRSVIDHATYHKTKRCYRNNAPSDFLSLDVYPSLPEENE